jgi:hypothetical protein
MSETTGFGASSTFGVHIFYVQIPVAPRDPIRICEDFGFDGDQARRETEECRVQLARELWNAIRDEARRDFNDRLKAKKISTGSWSTGKVKLERFLGRELCVLAWAAEQASIEECLIICQKWLALRPEERWWLYAKTSSEARMAEDTQRGWRKALYCLLSDGIGIKLSPKVKSSSKKKTPKKEEENPLLPFLFGGETPQ